MNAVNEAIKLFKVQNETVQDEYKHGQNRNKD